MCHFYANSLSALSQDKMADVLQTEHLEAIRNAPSFRRHIEGLVASDDAANLTHAKELLEDDKILTEMILASGAERDAWVDKTLRSLLISEAAGAQEGMFSEAYVRALEAGISAEDAWRVSSKVQRMEADELAKVIQRVVEILDAGDQTLRLDPSAAEADHTLRDALIVQGRALDQLRATATEQDIPLRSKYSGQSRVMRTTVIAQRVQLSRDTAALRDEDKQFTEIIDGVVKVLADYLSVPGANSIFLSEAWLYDSRAPLRDVLVPRPQIVFKRCLTRPHDYLGCSCCKPNDDETGGMQATLPATSILYQMYLETGNLINVADLWTAFYGLVGADDGGDGEERKALAAFYRGMAELRALGFVKPSKKKADHVAKVKWL
jgi:origin recognition complex subunit 3